MRREALTPAQAAQQLGINESELNRLQEAGQGPEHLHITPRTTRYFPEDLDRWTASTNQQHVTPTKGEIMFTTSITIEGRLADDPTVLESMTELVVLTNRRGTDEAGEWQNTDTTRFVVKAFKRLAENTQQLSKGDKVLIAGSITTDTWNDKDTGGTRYQQVVMADAIGQSL